MRLDRKSAAIITAIMLATTASPAAAAISVAQVRSASTQAARAVAKQTHAANVKVTSCSRVKGGKAVCHAEAHYATGARRCTFDVIVKQGTAKGRPPRSTPSNFVCY